MSDSKRDLQKVLGDLKALQERDKSTGLSSEEKSQWTSLVNEAKQMQDAADRENQAREVEQWAEKSRQVVNPILPAEGKQRQEAGRMYASLGDAFVTSPEYKQFINSGMPRSGSQQMATEGFFRASKGRNLVPLSHERGMEVKAVATLGSGVIDETRLAEIVWQTEYDELNLLSVIPTSSTDSNAVEWIRKTTYTRNATTVADLLTGENQKPETTSAYTLVNTPVRTMAVWHPVTKQQVADFRQLRGLIDGDLLYDLGKLTEEQILYGGGTGTDFAGIFPAISAARTVSGDTLIDEIKRGMTDVRIAGHRPNYAVMHPLDWETILLTKDEESRYIWAVVTSENGMRLWALPVIENESCLSEETGERNVLVADMRRLSTLWMRETPNVAVGWIDDQFVKNQYTILAEQRAAFAVQRPLAGRKIQTVEPES